MSFNTTLTFLTWLGANAFLILAAYRLARRLFPADEFHCRALHVLLLWRAAITGSVLLAGSTGLLTGWSPLLLVAALSVGYLIYSEIRPESLERPLRPTSHSARRAELVSNAVLVSLWAGLVVTDGLGKFPSDFDSLMYHIPFVNYWLQDSRLYTPECCHWSVPGGNEVMGFWMVAPFRGDFLIALGNLPSVLLLNLATLELGLICGLSRPLGHATAFAVTANFVVMNQLVERRERRRRRGTIRGLPWLGPEARLRWPSGQPRARFDHARPPLRRKILRARLCRRRVVHRDRLGTIPARAEGRLSGGADRPARVLAPRRLLVRPQHPGGWQSALPHGLSSGGKPHGAALSGCMEDLVPGQRSSRDTRPRDPGGGENDRTVPARRDRRITSHIRLADRLGTNPESQAGSCRGDPGVGLCPGGHPVRARRRSRLVESPPMVLHAD